MTSSTITTKRQCELCQKSLAASDYCICKQCDVEFDKYRVWKGRKMLFNFEPKQQQSLKQEPKERPEPKQSKSKKKQGRGQLKLV